MCIYINIYSHILKISPDHVINSPSSPFSKHGDTIGPPVVDSALRQTLPGPTAIGVLTTGLEK